MVSAKSFHRKVFYNIRAINNNTKVEIGFTENNAKNIIIKYYENISKS